MKRIEKEKLPSAEVTKIIKKYKAGSYYPQTTVKKA